MIARQVIALMVALNLVAAFYLQTQSDQMSLLFDAASAGALSQFLEFGFPLLGFVASILAVKHVFERSNGREIMCWVWPAGLGCAFCMVQMMPLLVCQYIAAVLFGPMRTMQWACYFNALAVAPRYPQRLAGRVLGYNNIAIALVPSQRPPPDPFFRHGVRHARTTVRTNASASTPRLSLVLRLSRGRLSRAAALRHSALLSDAARRGWWRERERRSAGMGLCVGADVPAAARTWSVTSPRLAAAQHALTPRARGRLAWCLELCGRRTRLHVTDRWLISPVTSLSAHIPCRCIHAR